MYFHVIIKIYVPPSHLIKNHKLIDVNIPELDINLKGATDVVLRRPYRNKHFYVIQRKIGRKAMNGLLISTTKKNLQSISIITNLLVNESIKTTHEAVITILDHEHDVISNDASLWFPSAHLSSRWSSFTNSYSPMQLGLVVEFVANKDPFVVNTVDQVVGDFIVHRKQQLPVHTIELNRLYRYEEDRIPTLDQAIES